MFQELISLFRSEESKLLKLALDRVADHEITLKVSDNYPDTWSNRGTTTYLEFSDDLVSIWAGEKRTKHFITYTNVVSYRSSIKVNGESIPITKHEKVYKYLHGLRTEKISRDLKAKQKIKEAKDKVLLKAAIERLEHENSIRERPAPRIPQGVSKLLLSQSRPTSTSGGYSDEDERLRPILDTSQSGIQPYYLHTWQS